MSIINFPESTSWGGHFPLGAPAFERKGVDGSLACSQGDEDGKWWGKACSSLCSIVGEFIASSADVGGRPEIGDAKAWEHRHRQMSLLY
jgi:hypothetical protein